MIMEDVAENVGPNSKLAEMWELESFQINKLDPFRCLNSILSFVLKVFCRDDLDLKLKDKEEIELNDCELQF